MQASAHRDTSSAWIPPEWLKFVTPLLVAIVGLAFNNLSNRLHDMQAILDRMPLDYIPRAELVRNGEVDKKLSEERDARLSRIEAKLDELRDENPHGVYAHHE